MSSETLYLGVDPGRDKTGAALVTGDGALVRQAVLPTACFLDVNIFGNCQCSM